LVADLEAAGADVWWDTGQIASGNFVHAINEGLSGRQWLVLVMTPDSLQSRWVQEEVDAALHQVNSGRMLGVIPVVAKLCDERSIPALWATLHRYDATRAYESARDGLLHALGLTSTPHYLLPDVPVHLASLGFRSVNVNSTPAIIPPLVTIPAGRFLMGSDRATDSRAGDEETPQHWVEVGGFQMAKYPVTVAEYALAVRAGAVREPPDSADVTWVTQQGQFDHPVVCVSWWDATAYCAWLVTTTRQRGWRLPTEAEWEKAARWDPQQQVSRTYPWGDTFDKARCNTSESGIKTTTPVDSYPASDAWRSGASPFGVEDMAGNAEEWTSSVDKPYPYTTGDGREDQESRGPRIIRGGSRSNVAEYARAAFRLSAPPDSFYNGRGFRLVLGSLAGS
jgi:toxoflavin biosynthesis protein ToxD